MEKALVEVGDITRFPDRGHFASWNGTAPIDASSGQQIRHRLSRAGNRQINRVLHIMARVQIRNPSEGRDYYDRKKAGGKSSMEAMRCLKRRLSDIVFKTMLDSEIHHTIQIDGSGPADYRSVVAFFARQLLKDLRLVGGYDVPAARLFLEFILRLPLLLARKWRR